MGFWESLTLSSQEENGPEQVPLDMSQLPLDRGENVAS
jgi:hypothetical protein